MASRNRTAYIKGRSVICRLAFNRPLGDRSLPRALAVDRLGSIFAPSYVIVGSHIPLFPARFFQKTMSRSDARSLHLVNTAFRFDLRPEDPARSRMDSVHRCAVAFLWIYSYNSPRIILGIRPYIRLAPEVLISRLGRSPHPHPNRRYTPQDADNFPRVAPLSVTSIYD